MNAESSYGAQTVAESADFANDVTEHRLPEINLYYNTLVLFLTDIKLI